MNRSNKRKELTLVEGLLLQHTQRVVRLDETIKALKSAIEIEKNPETLETSKSKLQRLSERAKVVGHQYDELVNKHLELKGDKSGLVSIMGNQIEPVNDTISPLTDYRSTRVH